MSQNMKLVLGSLIAIGLGVSFVDWKDFAFLKSAIVSGIWGIFLILVFWLVAVRVTDIWRQGSKIFDGWDGLVMKVDEMHEILMADNKAGLDEAKSPRRLTRKGKSIAKKIHANELLARYGDQFDVSGVENAYDIQQMAKKWADDRLPDLMEESDLNRIKDIAFQNGLQLSIILRTVIGLLLRDRILEQKGIPLTQIDEDERG